MHLFQIKILSDFISAYRNGHSADHVFIRPIENLKTTLDKSLFTEVDLVRLI